MEWLVKKVGTTRLVKQLYRDGQRLLSISTEGDHVVDEVARMTPTHLQSTTLVVLLAQMINDGLVEGDTVFLADHVEDLRKLLERRVRGVHLVWNAPQKRLICELARLEVGREDNEDVEGDLEFSTGVQCQEVDARFEGHDPPVEQLAGGDTLTPEVVDEEHPTVRLQLHRD